MNPSPDLGIHQEPPEESDVIPENESPLKKDIKVKAQEEAPKEPVEDQEIRAKIVQSAPIQQNQKITQETVTTPPIEFHPKQDSAKIVKQGMNDPITKLDDANKLSKEIAELQQDNN